MGFFKRETELPVDRHSPISVDETARPSVKDISRAVYRTENIIGSFFAKEEGLPDYKETDFDPWQYMSKDEKMDDSFLQYAMYSDNEDELNAVRRQVSRERKDRQTIADGGANSVGISIGQGILDPINLLVAGGAVANTYRRGESILKSGAVTAGIVASETAIYESALHASQLERTFGESAINIAGSSVLGMSLGAGIQKFANRGLYTDVEKGIQDNMDVESKVQAGINPAIDESDPVAAEALKSVGAAQVDGDFKISGKAAEFIAKKLRFMDPLTRTLTSEAPITRQIMVNLAENPYKMDGGITQAVESFATMHRTGKLSQGLQAGNDIFKKYKRAGGTMKKNDFNEAVAKAFRSGKSDVPEVLEAAESWRKTVYDPMKMEMIEQKMLPEDVDVSTANNYLNRIWNKEKISANFPQFTNVVAKWLQDKDLELFNQAKKARTAIKTAQGKEKKELQAIIDKADLKDRKDLAFEDYEDIAGQIAVKIQGTPDGRLPYDWQIGNGSKLGTNNGQNLGGTALRGPLRSRTFQIPDELVEDFLENDIERLAERYLQHTSADVELKKTFGDVTLEQQLASVRNYYTDLARQAKTPKESSALLKAMDDDIRDIAGIRDRIRGIYGFEADTGFTRVLRASRNLNYLRLLGGVTISSVPDIARVFMAEGFVQTFKTGLIPLAKNLKTFKIAAAEAKRYGVGIDAILGERGNIIADIADYTQGGTAIERALQRGAQKFGKVNALDFWTSGVKQLHAVTMQTAVFDKLQKGIFDKRLTRLGISEEDAKAMWKQVEKHGQKIDGVWVTNAKNWDSTELERMWGAAVRKESDRVIIVPGQEKPLFMSREMGKSVMQFRSFMFSSTQRVFIASLQDQDHNALGGMLGLIGIGAFTYTIKQRLRGKEVSDDPLVLMIEGIDNSGALGALMEVNNTWEKISNNTLGLRPFLGTDLPASRFASRSTVETIAGPTFGSFVNTGAQAMTALSSGEITDSDIRAMRRLLPYQNLFYVRNGLDKVEEALGDL